MLILLLGPDGFSKRQYVQEQAAKTSSVAVFFAADEMPPVDSLTGADLFSKAGVFVLSGLIEKFNQPEVVERLVASKNQIIFIEEKLDKRLSANKNLLANKNIAVKEFILPRDKELNNWIANRAKFYHGKISPAAVEELAKRLGRDQAKETKAGGKVVAVEEVYNLWQADAEIQKLLALAAGREISAQDVKSLISENAEIDVFDITNAIADGQKQTALELLHRHLKNQAGADEKGSIIQLNALLSEQFRNVAMVQDFISQKKSESQILEATGWKSGRLFVMKKVAQKFAPKKVLEFLAKLAALDEELKSTSTPPKVLLDLIVSQLLL